MHDDINLTTKLQALQNKADKVKEKSDIFHNQN